MRYFLILMLTVITASVTAQIPTSPVNVSHWERLPFIDSSFTFKMPITYDTCKGCLIIGQWSDDSTNYYFQIDSLQRLSYCVIPKQKIKIILPKGTLPFLNKPISLEKTGTNIYWTDASKTYKLDQEPGRGFGVNAQKSKTFGYDPNNTDPICFDASGSIIPCKIKKLNESYPACPIGQSWMPTISTSSLLIKGDMCLPDSVIENMFKILRRSLSGMVAVGSDDAVEIANASSSTAPLVLQNCSCGGGTPVQISGRIRFTGKAWDSTKISKP